MTNRDLVYQQEGGQAMVRFILYASKPAIFTQEIAHIQSLAVTCHSSVLITDNLFKLIHLVAQTSKQESVAILFAATDEELKNLVELRGRISSIPTILVLPDDDIDTLQKGMLLSPLYFMARYAETSQFTVAINELCHIYAEYNHTQPMPGQSFS